ncbi:MAG: hypothetical protein Q4E61_01630, partial [Alphaproteobacteria bacterium]|nr:hypothetical protein [Alphaproteobacteria bacterium]
MKINSMKTLNKFIVLMIAIFLMMAMVPFNVSALNKGEVKIGQATSGEGGKLRGCRAGDQSGGEVSVSNWSYASGSGSSYHWVYVFRAKNPVIAKKISKVMKQIAANNHVGYDKNAPDRYTLYDQAKANNWDVTKITNDCETTCSSAVAVALNCAGVRVPKLLYSQIVYEEIMKTKKFDCYTTSDYTASPDKLMEGDILCNPKHHTAMVVESPN